MTRDGLATRDDEAHAMGDPLGHPADHDSNNASAITWAPKIGDRFGLVIVDEAHHVGAECPSEVLEMLVADARLGLTATPPLQEAATALECHVGPVVYALSIDDLVGDALAGFDLVTIPISLTPEERKRYHAARSAFAKAFAAFQRDATRVPRLHAAAPRAARPALVVGDCGLLALQPFTGLRADRHLMPQGTTSSANL